MERIDEKTLQELKKVSTPFCLSAYLPLRSDRRAAAVNAVLLGDLIRYVGREMLRRGASEKETVAFLDPLVRLKQDQSSARILSGGTAALFRSADYFRAIHLPFESETPVKLSDHFDTRPLEIFLSRHPPYFVLAVSQHSVRLFEGSAYGIKEVRPAKLPHSLQEALRLDELEKELQTHPIAAGGRGEVTEMIHSHGPAKNTLKRLLDDYFQRLDKPLHRYLRRQHAPLIFAGVGYLFPKFKKANTYPYLLQEFIEGNPEKIKAPDLFKRAVTLVANHARLASMHKRSRTRYA